MPIWRTYLYLINEAHADVFCPFLDHPGSVVPQVLQVMSGRHCRHG
jgi:hypothetical protein